MPFNGTGGFTVYTPGNPAVPGTAISSAAFNATMNDVATGLANTLTRDGQSPATANIPMGGFKLTGLAAATGVGQAISFDQLTASSGSSLIGYLPAGAGAVPTTVQQQLRNIQAWTVNALDYGLVAGVGNGAANSTALNAVTAAAIAAKAGIVIPAGYYEFPTNWNAITATGQSITSVGGIAELHFTGTGVAVTIGAAATNIYNCVFGGDVPIRVTGTATCTDTVLVRRLHTSKVNVWVANCTAAGVRATYTVLSDIRVVCNANTEPGGVYVVQPVNGIVITEIGAGEYSTTTKVYPNIQGTSGAGIAVGVAQYMSIVGGASEGCDKGITLSANSRLISVTDTDFETNTTSNIEDLGSSNSFFNVTATQSVSSLFNGTGTKIFGGQYRDATLSASSEDIGFFGVGFASGASLVPSTGTYQLNGCYTYDGNGVWNARLKDVFDGGQTKTWTPVLSSSGGGAEGASTSTGFYTVIGDMCFCTGLINVAKGTLGVGNLTVLLPFPGSSLMTQQINLSTWETVALSAGNSHIALQLPPSQQSVPLLQSGLSTAVSTITVAMMPSTIIFAFSGVYRIL